MQCARSAAPPLRDAAALAGVAGVAVLAGLAGRVVAPRALELEPRGPGQARPGRWGVST